MDTCENCKWHSGIYCNNNKDGLGGFVLSSWLACKGYAPTREHQWLMTTKPCDKCKGTGRLKKED